MRLLPALVCTRPAGGQREVLWGYLLGRLEAVTEGQGPLAEWVLLPGGFRGHCAPGFNTDDHVQVFASCAQCAAPVGKKIKIMIK